MNSTYVSIIDAITDLKKRGYNIDYNIELTRTDADMSAEGYLIVEAHRFEGQTSSDDEAVIYAIEAPDGSKGFLANGYGISSDPRSDEFIKKMKTAY